MTLQYDLMAFPAVDEPETTSTLQSVAKGPSTRNARRVAARTLEIDTQKIERLESINDLAAWKLPPLALQVACHGDDPEILRAESAAASIDIPTDQFPTRSEAL